MSAFLCDLSPLSLHSFAFECLGNLRNTVQESSALMALAAPWPLVLASLARVLLNGALKQVL